MVVSIGLSSGRAARLGERAEVDVLETGGDRGEPVARIAIGEDVNDGPSGEEPRREDLVPFPIAGELAAIDDLHPDAATRRVNQVLRRPFDLNPSVCKHGHAVTE